MELKTGALSAIVDFMGLLQPFVDAVVSDVLCVSRNEHAYVRRLAGTLRPYESFVYYQLLRHILQLRDCSKLKALPRWQGLNVSLLQLACRAVKVQSIAEQCAVERILPNLWLRYCRCPNVMTCEVHCTSAGGCVKNGVVTPVVCGQQREKAVGAPSSSGDSSLPGIVSASSACFTASTSYGGGTGLDSGSVECGVLDSEDSRLFYDFITKNAGLCVDAFQGGTGLQATLLRAGVYFFPVNYFQYLHLFPG